MLPDVRQRLIPRQHRLFRISLKLHQLELDLQVVVLANGADLVLAFAYVHGSLKALHIRVRQVKHRFRKLNVVEELADLKRHTTLVIEHLRAGHGRRVLGGLQAALTLLASFNQVTHPKVALGRALEILRHRLAGQFRDRQVFPVGENRRVRAQIGRDFRGLALLDGGPRSLQGVVVLQRQIDGLLQRNLDRSLRERQIQPQAEHDGRNDNTPIALHRQHLALSFHWPSKEPSGSGS